MSALENENSVLEPVLDGSESSGSVETKEFTVKRNLGDSVASELLGGGHPRVKFVKVVNTTREDCNLIVTATILKPEESSALHERIVLLIQSARARLQKEASLFDHIFPKKGRQAA